MRTIRYTVLLIGGLGLAGLSACGSSSSGAGRYGISTVVSTTAPSTTASGATTSNSTGANGATVSLADTSLGKALVAKSGNSIYMFMKDTATSSACGDGCIGTWPPIGAADPVVPGTGLDAAGFGTLVRSDGAKQLTYKGHPLYLFAPDTSPGDIKGEGVGGVWFLIDAGGNAIKK